MLLTPLLAGLLPVLILAAARRRGRAIGRAKLGGIAALSFAGVLAHGLYIWDDPLKQGVALLVALAMLAFAVDSWSKGAFRRRWLPEVRVYPEAGGRAEIDVTYGGRPAAVELRCHWNDGGQTRHRAGEPLSDFRRCRRLAVALPEVGPPAPLQVLVQRVSGDFETEPIAAEVRVLLAVGENAGEARRTPLTPLTHGTAQLRLPRGAQGLEVDLAP